MVQPGPMLPGQEIWSELEARLQAAHPSIAPVVFLQSELGPDAGGPPLSRIVAYPATTPSPHWHFVTCGLSASRFIPSYPSVGDIELSFRLARKEDEQKPPAWVGAFLQQLGQIAFQEAGPIEVEAPLSLGDLYPEGEDTALTMGYCIEDPTVGPGAITLIQVVALTRAERSRVEVVSNNRSKLVLEVAPAGISDLDRERRAPPAAPAAPKPPPPPRPVPKLDLVDVKKVGSRMRVTIVPDEVKAFTEAIAESAREGRVTFSSQGWTIHLVVEDIARSATWSTTLMIYFTLELSKQVAAELQDPARRGQPLQYAALPDAEFLVRSDGPAKPADPAKPTTVLGRLGKFFSGS